MTINNGGREIPAPLPPEISFEKAMFQMFEGKQVRGEAGGWVFSNLNSPTQINLVASDSSAVYEFDIDHSNNILIIQNHDRSARKGSGTTSLQQLEEIFKHYSEACQKGLRIIFPKFNQEDTAAWLLKNGYLPFEVENNTYFYKDFTVEK